MNKLSTITTAVALTLGIAAAATAHQGEGRGMSPGMQHGMHQGMNHGESHGKHGEAKGHGKHGAGRHSGHSHNAAGTQGPGGPAHALMSAEERTAFRDRMRNAASPEERQQIALAQRAEMQKRAAEKGITLPEHRGPRGHGHNHGPAGAPQSPGNTD